MTSISCPARTSKSRQRGFVLITAIVLAVLYFALMELLLIESSRSLAEAQRFRARVVAATLAENGAELAALQIVNGGAPPPLPATDSQGTMNGTLRRVGVNFELVGTGRSAGVITQSSTVTIQGRIDPADGTIKIDYTNHGQ